MRMTTSRTAYLCWRAPKLAMTPSLSMRIRSDVVRRHDDGVVAPTAATQLVDPTAQGSVTSAMVVGSTRVP